MRRLLAFAGSAAIHVATAAVVLSLAPGAAQRVKASRRAWGEKQSRPPGDCTRVEFTRPAVSAAESHEYSRIGAFPHDTTAGLQLKLVGKDL